MNSLWLVITALAAFLVAYRFYGAFLAAKVAVLNDRQRHARPPAARRRRLSSHAAAGAVRRPFCRHRRLGAAGRTGAGVAMGLFSRLLLDRHRLVPGRRRSRLRGAAGLGAAGRQVAAEDRPRPAWARLAGIATTVATLLIIVTTLAGNGQGGRQRPERKRLGHVHDRRHDSRPRC